MPARPEDRSRSDDASVVVQMGSGRMHFDPLGRWLARWPAVTHWFHPRPQKQRVLRARNKDAPSSSTNTQSKLDMAEGS